MNRIFTYTIPDEDIIQQFGSLEKFKNIVMSCDLRSPEPDEPASDEEKEALNEFVAAYQADSQEEDVWTDLKGGWEESYRLNE